MRITKDIVVSLQVELSDIWGQLIDRSEEPVQYLHGGYGDIFPLAEAALEGKTHNDRVEVRLEPEDAYGDYDEGLLNVVPLSALPTGIEVGMRIEGEAVQQPDVPIYTITDIADGKAILDGNHPLAGMALKFVATVVELRPATATELENRGADDSASVIMRAVP